MTEDPDPKGLIREAYRIAGITDAECRSIFLDWALSVPPQAETRALIEVLLARHAPLAQDHPMTRVLLEGLAEAPAPRRRGGARRRAQD